MQPEAKIKLFEEELSLIPDGSYRKFVEDCLCLAPDYFFEVSASDSNLHHPYWDLGFGGTVRHTKAVTKTAFDLSGTIIQPGDKESLSKLLAACILHDSCKYGFSFDLRMYLLHPYLPRVAFGKVTTGRLSEEQKDWIFRAIESHMGPYYNGKWAPLHYITYDNLREDPLAYLVHQADYLVSREDYIFPKFRDINKGIDTSKLPYYDPFPDHMLKGLILGVMLGRMEKDDVIKALNDGVVDNLLSRVAAYRTPYSSRKRYYNYDSLVKIIEDNLEKFIGVKGD